MTVPRAAGRAGARCRGRQPGTLALALALAGLAALTGPAGTVTPDEPPPGEGCGEGTLGVIVESLPSLQTGKGGFGRPPTLVATQRALFLAQLYGLGQRINRERAREFVTHALLASPAPEEEAHEGAEHDKGKGAEGGAQDKAKGAGAEHDKGRGAVFRSVDDLHAAILCSQALGLEPHLPGVGAIIAFLLSLWDEATGLFGRVPGGAGDIRSSALAMAVAEQQGKRHALTAQVERMRTVLQSCSHPRNRTAAVCNGTHLALFDVPRELSRGLPPVSINYFAVLLAQLCDFPLPAARAAAMIADIGALQNRDRQSAKFGGVFEDCLRSSVSLEASAYAAATLQELRLLSSRLAGLSRSLSASRVCSPSRSSSPSVRARVRA